MGEHFNNCDWCGRETPHDEDEVCIRCGHKNEPDNYYDQYGRKIHDGEAEDSGEDR